MQLVSKYEVWNALHFMKAFKAKGPNGSQPFFVKRYWGVLGDDVCLVVRIAFKIGMVDERILELC